MKDIKTKEIIIEVLKKTPIIQIACEKASIARATFYRWRKTDKVFAQAIDKALSEGINLVNEMAESQLISAIKDQNMTAIMFWLKHHKQVYSNKLEIKGKVTTEYELSKEEKEIIKQALQNSSLLSDEKSNS
jgi:hypothetical protein